MSQSRGYGGAREGSTAMEGLQQGLARAGAVGGAVGRAS